MCYFYFGVLFGRKVHKRIFTKQSTSLMGVEFWSVKGHEWVYSVEQKCNCNEQRNDCYQHFFSSIIHIGEPYEGRYTTKTIQLWKDKQSWFTKVKNEVALNECRKSVDCGLIWKWWMSVIIFGNQDTCYLFILHCNFLSFLQFHLVTLSDRDNIRKSRKKDSLKKYVRA